MREIACQVVDGRLDALRRLAQQIAEQRHVAPEPVLPPQVDVHVPEQPAPIVHVTNEIPQSLPPINVQVIVPPEAIKVIFESPPANVTVNVPEQPTPKITVQAPNVTVEPKIDVHIPPTEQRKPPSRARIKHADGTSSTVEIA